MKNLATYDLHLHTEWSYDALAKVEDYFQLARERRLRAIAITDHHLMDAYGAGDVAAAAAKYPDVRFFAGGELTVHCPLGTYDLVCLNLPLQPECGELVELWKTYREWQRACGHAYSVNFTRLCGPFDDDARMRLLKSYRAPRIIAKHGNSHVRFATMRDEAIRRGWVRDQDDYWRLYSSFTDVPDYPEYDYVVPRVKRAGGVVIIAHPYGYFEHDNVKLMDELREMLQLDGIECAHPSVPPEATAFYRDYCVKHGLLSSGGSDLHEAPFDSLAEHCGQDKWLDELCERATLH